MSGRRNWTAAEDRLLGTASDGAIAKELGRSKASVKLRRIALKIAPSTDRTPEVPAPAGSLPIPGHAPYHAGRDGTIWGWHFTWKRWAEIAPIDVRGCSSVILKVGGRQVNRTVAGLVCLAFHGPRPAGYEANHHPDIDPKNNRADNLRWAPKGASKVGRRPRSSAAKKESQS